jgi:putative ABC transport system ATP-binding protein
VAIARAVANRPDVLLADEPTGNLDRANTKEVLALLADMHRAGQTIVMVTHDREVAAAADVVATMVDGQLEAPPGELAGEVAAVPHGSVGR